MYQHGNIMAIQGGLMQSVMIKPRRRESGFGLQEAAIIFLVMGAVGVALVLLGRGFFNTAHKSRLQSDLTTVQNAADDYYLRTLGKFPTSDGNPPPAGQLALIDFNATYSEGGQTYTFSNLITRLPRHYDEGVWQIDSLGKVSVAVDPKQY
jgi:hypothetical protein